MSDYNFSNLSVMIVDDCPPILYLLRSILKEFGVTRIIEATDGQDALEALPGADPDIIFTDYMMEPMDGLSLIKAIRSGETPVDKFIPIVVVSAYTEVHDILTARDTGATEFLAKPVSGLQVYRRLKSIVENPRTFVEAESFFGPDRRRQLQTIADEDRRTMPYTYASATGQRAA